MSQIIFLTEMYDIVIGLTGWNNSSRTEHAATIGVDMWFRTVHLMAQWRFCYRASFAVVYNCRY
uniref:Uncharacterized protein n=1 Tax=Paracidobacterium acidisoli TaxID=2303751 RepID=A0A372IJ97_9BACT